MHVNPLQHTLSQKKPRLPEVLNDPKQKAFEFYQKSKTSKEIAPLFKAIYKNDTLKLAESAPQPTTPITVGVLFSGGQAPGGHNVIWGLFDYIKKLHTDSRLMGFLNGPKGLVEKKYIELSRSDIAPFRNSGGFQLLGSGRTKIEGPELLEKAFQSASELKLDGLVVIGGDDSNTNAAILANYFKQKGGSTCVIGVPKTIDGDLQNEYVDISFGYDTACRVYSELIGNIAMDALSAKKYTHFIKLMGRAASHVTLECALQTQPNLAFIGEEIKSKQITLKEIVEQIANMVIQRSKLSKEYGVVLIPEGLIDFIPEFSELNQEINSLLASNPELNHQTALESLSSASAKLLQSLPLTIQKQLFLDRDPHGNIQLAKISTHQLLIEMTQKHLEKISSFTGSFNPLSHYLGYEGRCSIPSPFDADYTYTLGASAAMMVQSQLTGYMACVHGLKNPVEQWEVYALPITNLLNIEKRHGKEKPVIKKALVNLKGNLFKHYEKVRNHWLVGDEYNSPGPIQFFGDSKIIDVRNYLLDLC